MEVLLDSTQAARRLGVKRSTLYVYVSRGLLTSRRALGSHQSLFVLDEVERLAERSRAGHLTDLVLPPLKTSITILAADAHCYRGHPVTDFLGARSFEEVAEFLWKADPEPWVPLDIPVTERMGREELIRIIVSHATELDPTAADLSPKVITGFARRLIATLAAAVAHPVSGEHRKPSGEKVSELAAVGLVGDGALARHVDAVEAVLIVLADHELAPSTLSVRIAANLRASLSNAVLAGLGVLAGPLHDASYEGYRLLQDADRLGPENALTRSLEEGNIPTGFDRERDDPRVPLLLNAAASVASPGQFELVTAVLDGARELELPSPGIDFGVAAVAWALGAGPDAGPTLFALARIAGWTAHYLEELSEPTRRFRFHPVYVASD